MLKIFKQYYPIRNVFFILGEGLVIFFSVFMSCKLFIGADPDYQDLLLNLRILLITFVSLVCLYYNDLYNFKIVNSPVEVGIRLIQAIGASAIVLALIYSLFPHAVIGNGVFVVSSVFLLIFIVSWRMIYTCILKYGFMNQNIIILGSGDIAQIIADKIEKNIDCGYAIAAHVHENQDALCDRGGNEKRISTRGGYEGLVDLARKLDVKRIVVAIYERRGAFPAEELLKCRVAGIEIIEGDSFYERLTGKIIVEHIKPAALIFSKGFECSFLRTFLKRLEDLFFSILLLALSSPLMFITALLIKLDSKGPVFFSQERLGKNRQPYKIHKFRSMVTDAEKKSGPVWAKDKDDRVTRVGHFIRKWRIDELPQLINVLRGDMSFVGPRPERDHFIKELEQRIPFYSERFSVKPGLTGWAQINYGYGANIEDAIEKLNYELFYIKNMSITMDLVIIFRTVRTVLFGEGAR